MSSSTDTISFIQFQQPPLKSGEYALTLDQTITVPTEGCTVLDTELKATTADSTLASTLTSKNTHSETYSITKYLYVASERFRLPPPVIHSQFPPPNNYGDHSNVLPHILLNRSTLPWERDANPNDAELPWLWLFVFDDQDIAAGHVVAPEQTTASSVITFLDPSSGKPLTSPANTSLPSLIAEPGEDLNAPVTVIKVAADWLKQNQIMPSAAALKLLTSVRANSAACSSNESSNEDSSNEDSNGENSSAWAICVANRLPLPGGNSYAHLVTLENRFPNGAFDFESGQDSQGRLSFISVAQWRFSCPDDICYAYTPHTLTQLQQAQTPTALIQSLQKLPETQLYESTATFTAAVAPLINASDQTLYQQWQPTILNAMQMPVATFKGLLQNINHGNLQLPLLKDAKYLSTANHYLKRGSVVLPHHLRYGGQTQSWYHGPLISGTDPNQLVSDNLPITLPITASDQLLRFDTALGMFDTSYAAAWELGRLLCLNNTDIATSLYAWKCQNAWDLAQQEQALRYDHLPFASNSPSTDANADYGAKLSRWFNELNLLYNVPFNYLVPDQRLLPTESIRFFTLDQAWVECLLDGAFSIGRVTTEDTKRDTTCSTQLPQATYPAITGFLLRSEVVSGWPSLEISGSSAVLTDEQMPENNDALTILRQSTLAPNVLLCLFNGVAKTVDIHLKPEALHFGFDRPFGAQTSYYKTLKNLSTGELATPTKTVNNQWLPPLSSDGASSTPNAESPARIVDVLSLNAAIATTLNQTVADFTSAQFALEMIEGVPRVRFAVAPASTPSTSAPSA